MLDADKDRKAKHRYMSCDILALNSSLPLPLPLLPLSISKIYPIPHLLIPSLNPSATHPLQPISILSVPTPSIGYPIPPIQPLVRKLASHRYRPSWRRRAQAFQFQLLEVDLPFHLVEERHRILVRAALPELLVQILVVGRLFGRLYVSAERDDQIVRLLISGRQMDLLIKSSTGFGYTRRALKKCMADSTCFSGPDRSAYCSTQIGTLLEEVTYPW